MSKNFYWGSSYLQKQINELKKNNNPQTPIDDVKIQALEAKITTLESSLQQSTQTINTLQTNLNALTTKFNDATTIITNGETPTGRTINGYKEYMLEFCQEEITQKLKQIPKLNPGGKDYHYYYEYTISGYCQNVTSNALFYQYSGQGYPENGYFNPFNTVHLTIDDNKYGDVCLMLQPSGNNSQSLKILVLPNRNNTTITNTPVVILQGRICYTKFEK